MSDINPKGFGISKSKSSRYRVVEFDGYFYPQYKFMFWWFYWKEALAYNEHTNKKFDTLYLAYQFLDEYIREQNKPIKQKKIIHYYEEK